MAAAVLTTSALPEARDLATFARTAGHLLAPRLPRSVGARVVRRRAGPGIQHLDHRDYAAGDELRHVDWRQTARQQRPIVRRFESESAAEWAILLDASASMAASGPPKWRGARHVAAAMSYALLEHGHRVALLAFGAPVLVQCAAGRGRRHYATIARTLARLGAATMGERCALAACAPHLAGAASVLVISDFLAPDEMRGDLATVLERTVALHAVQVRSPHETELAGAGEVELVDAESGARIMVDAHARLRDAVDAERRAKTARLRAFCGRHGIAFTDWDLAVPWPRMLVRHLVEAWSRC